jgi:hypothetical protein
MSPHQLTSRLAATISFARWKGLVPVTVYLALTVLSINFGLLWLAGAAPRGFAQANAYLDWKYFDDAVDTVSSLVDEYRTSSPARKKPFLLYTGLSTAIEGIDPRYLAAHTGCDVPVVGICGTGGSMDTLLALQQPLLQTDLTASLVIVSLHPGWLAGMYYEPPESLNPLDPLRRGDWAEAAQRIRWWNWIGRSIYYSNQVAFKVLYTARINLGTAASVDPWLPPERIGYRAAHGTAANLKAQNALLGGFGWFDERRYALKQEIQAADLRTLISRYRARGAEVLLVIMPEASAFLDRTPPEAKQFLLDYLRREFRTDPVSILDYQHAIADSRFADYLHMNDEGRAEFTIRLAEGIRNAGHEYPRLNPCR